MIHGTELKTLHGRTVLVKSTRDLRNPPVALRGTLEVLDSPEAPGELPLVSIAVEFPQMFTQPAHRRNIVLSEMDLDRLLATERRGTFEFTMTDELM
jgi:hypothetical protein